MPLPRNPRIIYPDMHNDSLELGLKVIHDDVIGSGGKDHKLSGQVR
jgi:hypothetical protein